MSAATPAVALLLTALAACASSPSPAPAVAKAVLVVESPTRDASLWIDDQPIGELSRLRGGVRVDAGAHRVELRHDAHHPRFAEVTLAPGERRVLELTLTTIEP
jgi:hypothetical protein